MGKSKGGRWKAEGNPWTYRHPQVLEGKWRCRRRHQGSGRVQTITVKDPDTDQDARNQRDAERVIMLIAARETVEAEEALKCPEERTLRERSIEDAFKQWLRTVKGEVRPPTYRDYECGLVNVMAPAFRLMGKFDIHTIDYSDIETLFTAHAKKCGWSGRTRQKHLALLRRVLDWAVKHRFSKHNPAREYTPPKSWAKAIRKSRDRGIALSLAQAQSLLKACRLPTVAKISCEKGKRQGRAWEQSTNAPKHLYTAVLIALRAGLRISNVLGLRWKHLTKGLTELHIPACEMKNDVDLDVPVHPELTTHFKVILDRQRVELGHAPKGSDFVLGAELGFLKSSFVSALKRAELSKVIDEKGHCKAVRFHDLRHTFSTWLAEFVPELYKDPLMGHASNSMSARYTHPPIEKLREHLNRLPWLEPDNTLLQKERFI